MSTRIRRCVECPKCHTRYLLGFSPYSNGSYLVFDITGSLEEFALYCSCGRPLTLSRWTLSELKAYQVLNIAYHRGYGASDEIVSVTASKAPPRTTAMTQQDSSRATVPTQNSIVLKSVSGGQEGAKFVGFLGFRSRISGVCPSRQGRSPKPRSHSDRL